ncbi:hypothetical protein NL676_010651 [Syzygium grande]|nr:hypothetical protein NL676_010651 [Syzygium grande]
MHVTRNATRNGVVPPQFSAGGGVLPRDALSSFGKFSVGCVRRPGPQPELASKKRTGIFFYSGRRAPPAQSPPPVDHVAPRHLPLPEIAPALSDLRPSLR